MAKQDPSRSVPLADAMRHSGVDRIVQERSTDFKAGSGHARSTHSAIFAEVKVDEQLGVIRVDPRRQRGRSGPDSEPQNSSQPDHGGRSLGHWHGVARGDR